MATLTMSESARFANIIFVNIATALSARSAAMTCATPAPQSARVSAVNQFAKAARGRMTAPHQKRKKPMKMKSNFFTQLRPYSFAQCTNFRQWLLFLYRQ